MWVIVLYDSILEKRDDTISDILGTENNEVNYKYLYKQLSYTRMFSGLPTMPPQFSVTWNIENAFIFKKEITALRKIESIKSSRSILGYQYSNSKDFHLKVVKLKQEDWNRIIDNKISRAKYKYDKLIDKLNKEKYIYK